MPQLLGSCQCCEPQSGFSASPVSRRAFLAGAAAVGTMLGAPAVMAQQPKPHRIDVHHHLTPPTWNVAARAAGAGQGPVYNWSVQKSLDDMDQAGVATAITSITTPSLDFLKKDDAVRIARESNDYAAKLIADHPGRFGMFATLPLPYVDETLKEIAYSLDTLKADGVCMMTSYEDRWLGHSAFAPVMDELNRRKAIVYTHPTTGPCCSKLIAEVPPPVIEYGTDTTRTIGSLIFSGTSKRVGDINWIFSHAGGTTPFLVERFTRLPTLSNRADPNRAKLTAEDVMGELRRFYYDTAQTAHRHALSSLMQMVDVSQVLYGTDFPFRTSLDHVKGLAAFFKPEDLKAIDRDNALRLLPRLRAA